MKHKIFIVLIILVALTLVSGITYSIFHSTAKLNSNDQHLAKFIFNTETPDSLEFSLTDLNPGDTEEYLFSVSNNDLDKISDVLVEYTLTIKTYHFAPFDIELYKLNNEEEELILVCDESYTRNEENLLICNTPNVELGYEVEKTDNYKLKVSFPSEYDDEVYSNLVDFINIEIKSWQKLED